MPGHVHEDVGHHVVQPDGIDRARRGNEVAQSEPWRKRSVGDLADVENGCGVWCVFHGGVCFVVCVGVLLGWKDKVPGYLRLYLLRLSYLRSQKVSGSSSRSQSNHQAYSLSRLISGLSMGRALSAGDFPPVRVLRSGCMMLASPLSWRVLCVCSLRVGCRASSAPALPVDGLTGPFRLVGYADRSRSKPSVANM